MAPASCRRGDVRIAARVTVICVVVVMLGLGTDAAMAATTDDSSTVAPTPVPAASVPAATSDASPPATTIAAAPSPAIGIAAAAPAPATASDGSGNNNSSGSSASRQLVPHECRAALHAFAGCMPSLSSLLTRAAAASGGAAGSGTGSIIGSLVPASFSPSRACCSSLETVDPTCLCTFASKAQRFFSSSSSSPAARTINAGNTGQAFSAKDVKAAAFNLPSFCGLQPRFLPAV